MLKFDVSIHARPAGATLGEPVTLDGRHVQPLDRGPSASAQPFTIGFEEASERLTALDPMIHLEPDGWFIWHSPKGESPVWQINGNLYDRQQRLWYVPLRGTCPEQVLLRVLTALSDDPAVELVFELTQAGVHVDLANLLASSVGQGLP